MFPQNFNKPIAPVIFEKKIKIKLLHPASTEEITDSGYRYLQFFCSHVHLI
ncbi:MAG: hypothetical protein P8X89_06695 [Reinekea sp.]